MGEKCLRFVDPPRDGCLKLNFNGASKGNSGPVGFGCVLRDRSGAIVWFCCGLLGVCDWTKAEVMALLMGLRELKKLGLHASLVVGDSATVIGWGKEKGGGSWKLAHLVNEIRDLSLSMEISYAHVPREHNSLADKLANWGVVFFL